VTSEGHKFWLPPKRCPKPLEFDSNNKMHLDFILAAANIRAFMFGIPQEKVITSEQVDSWLKDFPVVSFDASQTKVEPNTGENTEMELEELVKKLPKRETLSAVPMHVVEFEKDDDTNFHVAYVTACSNLRAANYDIPEADFQRTKMIAGKIIPAMISTTAVVSGLQCLEIFKVIQLKDKTIDSFRSSFANIAIPLYVFQSPLPCEVKKLGKGLEVSIWTSFEHHAPQNETVSQFLEAIKERYNVDVDSIAYDDALIFADYLLKGEERKNRLEMTLRQAYAYVKAKEKKTIPAEASFIELILGCIDPETEEDIEEFPPIKYFF